VLDWALLKELRQEWPAVRAAKWATAVALVLGVGVGFGAATLWWSGTTATLRERVAYWQDRAQNTISPRPDRHITGNPPVTAR
jgi:hypothetical protein